MLRKWERGRTRSSRIRTCFGAIKGAFLLVYPCIRERLLVSTCTPHRPDRHVRDSDGRAAEAALASVAWTRRNKNTRIPTTVVIKF